MKKNKSFIKSPTLRRWFLVGGYMVVFFVIFFAIILFANSLRFKADNNLSTTEPALTVIGTGTTPVGPPTYSAPAADTSIGDGVLSCPDFYHPNLTSIRNILITIAQCYLPFFLGFGAALGLITAGILYIMASGDSQKIEKAKKYLGNIVIGIVIGTGALVIVALVKNILSQLIGA